MFTNRDRQVLYCVSAKLDMLLQQEEVQMASMDDLKNEVSQNKTVMESAATLLDGIHTQLVDVQAKLDAAGVDTTALDEVVTSLSANTDSLAAAVARNTSAADEVHASGM